MLSPLRRPSPISSLSQCRTYAAESFSPSRSHSKRHDREHVPPAGDSRREHVPPHADSRRPYLAAQRNQYLFVRLKDGSVVSSMPELLGAVRGLERELGRVKDFQLQRDPYDPTRFLRWFRIRLEDPHYWDTLSESGRTLKLTIPVLPASAASRPGGIGIGDIQGLLDPQEKVEEEYEFGVPGVQAKEEGKEEGKEGKGEKEEGKEGKEGSVRTVEVSINRSTRKDPEQPIFLISKDRRMRIGQSFVGWGGFYQPSSSPSSSPSSTPSSPSSTSTSTPTSASASVFEVDGVSVAPTQTRADKEVPRMEGLKKRYANVAVEEVNRTEEEGESEREKERERESGEREGVLVGGEGQTEQEAVREQRDFDAILHAFEEAQDPVEVAKSTTTSSLPETEDSQPLASSLSSTPPSPSHSTTETTTPPSTQPPTPTSTTSKRALRKEKLLELARQNAQQPLPEALKARELDSQVLSEEEKAKEGKEGREKREGGRQAVRERLWRLMGGLLP